METQIPRDPKVTYLPIDPVVGENIPLEEVEEALPVEMREAYLTSEREKVSESIELLEAGIYGPASEEQLQKKYARLNAINRLIDKIQGRNPEQQDMSATEETIAIRQKTILH